MCFLNPDPPIRKHLGLGSIHARQIGRVKVCVSRRESQGSWRMGCNIVYYFKSGLDITILLSSLTIYVVDRMLDLWYT